MSPDPVALVPEEPSSFNRYAYGNNNPYKYVDPDGRWAIVVRFAIVIGEYLFGENFFAYWGIALAASGGSAVIDHYNQEHYKEDTNQNKDEKRERTINDPLPDKIDKKGNSTGEPDPEGVTDPYTQLGTEKGRKGNYRQGREWNYDENGRFRHVKDIDFTDHGRPNTHPDNPHQHRYLPNETGGTYKRNKQPEPLTQ